MFFDEELFVFEFMDFKVIFDGGYIVCGVIDLFDDGGVYFLCYGWFFKFDEYGCFVFGCYLFNSIVLEFGILLQFVFFFNFVCDFINFELCGVCFVFDGVFCILDVQGWFL